jgi:hypothetical protein
MASVGQLADELVDAIPETAHVLPSRRDEPVKGDETVLSRFIKIVEPQPVDLPEVELAQPLVGGWFARHYPGGLEATQQI